MSFLTHQSRVHFLGPVLNQRMKKQEKKKSLDLIEWYLKRNTGTEKSWQLSSYYLDLIMPTQRGNLLPGGCLCMVQKTARLLLRRPHAPGAAMNLSKKSHGVDRRKVNMLLMSLKVLTPPGKPGSRRCVRSHSRMSSKD